ncbi:MAG TPA: hypothetical protein VEY91_12515 [Candidatus Limnocylindria bacterium]|nr:hypothetical protein [Candidatus Limnocylindria bacterium]
MNAPRDLSRREFLLLAAAFATPLVPLHAFFETFSAPPGRPPSPAGKLVGLLRHPASARVIGTAYLEAIPAEADAPILVDAIAAGLEGGPAALRADANALRRRLLRRIEHDFELETTVRLQGWIVSRTEARLCALATLKLG